jgi:hypothetical protein
MLMLLNSIGKMAEVPTRQLVPLPSLETRPIYGPTIEFVHC